MRTILALLAVAILSGCVTSRVEEFLVEQPVLTGEDAIVILTNRQDAVVETERTFSDCLYSELQKTNGDVEIVSERAFKDALFPWFEPRLAPARADAIPDLLKRDGLSQRVDELNVRYLVWIHGESEARNKQGMMSCTLSPAGGGCVGVLSWDNASNYEASIWDLRKGESMGVITSEATGTSVVPAIGVPIPLIARTKNASCKTLADQLSSSLFGA